MYISVQVFLFQIEETKLKYEKLCEAALEKGKTHKTFNPLPWADSKWSPDDFKNKKQEMPITGIPEDVIHHILNAISAVPQGLVLHKGENKPLYLLDFLYKSLFIRQNKITFFSFVSKRLYSGK